MLNKIILIGAILCISINGFTQNTIKGTVFSEENEPLINATVVLLNPVDSTMKYFGVTNKNGYYQIKNIKKGTYLMQYSYVGAQMITDNITIPTEQGEDFGKRVLKWATIDEVLVVGEYVPIRFRSDTVEFNAKAFNTKADAVVEDLLKKIPGIEVDLAGNIKALGEEVTKVLVDGKEFFGRDKKVATKNLPADAIDKVQVFDKKSYEAEFMGIDDGVRDRTINLQLREDKKLGSFGNLLAGSGTGDHYQASGKLYKFSGNMQMAALGMYNNINEFGFSAQGMGKFGSQIKGLNTTGAGGLNLSYYPTVVKKYYISYLGSIRKSILEQQTDADYFSDKGSYFQSVNMDEENRNTPHSFDFGIHHRFNPENHLIFTGNIDISKNDLERKTITNSYTDAAVVNDLNSINNQISDLIQGSAKASYMAKLNKGRTQVKTGFSVSLNNHFSGSNLNNTTHIYNPDTLYNTTQFIDRHTDRFVMSFNPSLVQKIGKLWYITPEVRIGMNNEMIDQKQGDLFQENMPIDSLSPNFIREHKYIETALSFKRSTVTSQFNLTFKTGWNQYGTTLWDVSYDKPVYFHFLPGLSYEKKIRTGRRIKLRYSSSVNIPSAGQLLPVINTTNPLSLYQGNIDLKPEYRHNINLYLSIFDQFSFTSFFVRLNGTYTKDKISWSQTINEDLVKMNSPVNVPWDYTAYAYMNFSTPIRPIGIKINLTLTENWNRGINIINSDENTVNTLSHSINLSIENRIKEKLDAKIGSSISLTDSKYSIQESLNNLYFNTVYYGDVYYNPNDNWNFQFTARVINYNSESLNESLSVPTIDAAVSYYFLKGNRAVLTLRGIDLLDKNTGFQQISDINYLMQVQSNTISRYVMLSFKYRLSRMGTNKR